MFHSRSYVYILYTIFHVYFKQSLLVASRVHTYTAAALHLYSFFFRAIVSSSRMIKSYGIFTFSLLSAATQEGTFEFPYKLKKTYINLIFFFLNLEVSKLNYL